MTAGEAPIGLIAGRGALPLEVVGEAHRRGRRIVCVDIFEGDPRLKAISDAYVAPTFGDLGAIIETFRRHGVREVVLAGKVDKLPAAQRARLDRVGALVAGRLRDHRDTTILGEFLSILEMSGFEVGQQTRYLRHLVPEPGVLGGRVPTEPEAADIQAGLRVAAQVAALDIGQAVAVRNGAVVAVEAVEGTDEMIRRAGRLSPGVVVVKVSRPQQDLRYDLPVVGPQTMRTLAEARGTALAVEAGRTLVLERAEVVAAATASGIALVAVTVETPAS